MLDKNLKVVRALKDSKKISLDEVASKGFYKRYISSYIGKWNKPIKINL